MVLHSLKPCIQLAKAIASANLRTFEAISILAETDALYLGSLLVLIDKLQANTSLCKFILELLPTISAFQGLFRICERCCASVSAGMCTERKSKIYEDALGREGGIVDFNIMKCYS